MTVKIVVADCSWENLTIADAFLPPGAELSYCQCQSEEDVIRACAEADGILAEYAPLTERVLKSLSRCRIISQMTIGCDNVHLDAARERNIAVANVPGYCAKDVADHAMALILAGKRNIAVYDRMIRNRIWDQNAAPVMRRLETLTLGLYSYGAIARELAVRARGFGMTVLAYDPHIHRDPGRENSVQLVDEQELLQRSDIISCHLPLNESTRGFFNREKFSRMRRQPLFVNTSRGKVVNETDLIAALEQGLLSGAALDVMEKEPPDFSSPLMQMDNVIITPHVGFLSETSLAEVSRRAAQNIQYYFTDQLEKVTFV